MIHIAPCSCELHVRIRELESTVAACESAIGHEMARAEKAEAAIRDTPQSTPVNNIFCWNCAARQVRVEREVLGIRRVLEARVAELEAELVEARRHEHEAIEAYDRQYARAERAERERDAT